MRNVLYAVPFFGENTLRFIDALRRRDQVRLIAICGRSGSFSDAVLNRFHRIVQVDDCFNADQVEAAVAGVRRLDGPIHCLTSALEQIQPTLGEVRSRLDIPGMKREAVERFTNKAAMKAALREAGLPCARFALLRSPEDARSFAEQVGFPFVMKPPVGAGCRDTYLVGGPEELAFTLREVMPAPDRVVQAEEFIHGEESSFETITTGGKVRFVSMTHYKPGPLDCMRNPWIQYCVVFPKSIDGKDYDGIKEIGRRTPEALGMMAGFTHMEWFRLRDGRIVIGEIAARPPGVHIVPMMNYGHEANFFDIWARAVVDDAFDGPWERKWAVGVAFLRGAGRGKVSRVTGVEEVQASLGDTIVEARYPKVGQPKATGYEGEGYVIVKARETAQVEEALTRLIETIQVRYE